MTQGPPPLDYAPPPKPASRNRWWMVGLRIVGGTIAGIASGIMGVFLANFTHVSILRWVPALVVFAALLFVCIKYRRFGYVTGFVLAPFVAAVALVILLLIICGTGGKI